MVLLFLLCAGALFWLGLRITGAVLLALLWLCVKLPLTLVLWSIGLGCCCTLLLIPVGVLLFRTGARLLFHG